MAINQVTSDRSTTRTASDGSFSFKLRAGAYRILVDAPGAARFDRENIIVTAGRKPGRSRDEGVERSAKKPSRSSTRRRTSARPVTPGRQHRIAPARLARPRRDARPLAHQLSRIRPLRRQGRARARHPLQARQVVRPYNQNLLKGDYPSRPERLHDLSGVNTTTVELNRTPKPTDVSSDGRAAPSFSDDPKPSSSTT
jgi:hypothetical protein